MKNPSNRLIALLFNNGAVAHLVRAAAVVVLLLSALGLIVPAALAHARVEIGPYVVVIGWLTEPPIVGERNALYFEITEGETPVVGAEATLDAEIGYGGRTMRVNLNPTAEPGVYTAELFPTVRGQYDVRLFGTLGETAVDAVLEPEEVLPASQLHFPEPLPDLPALQAQVAALEEQAQSARLFGLAGLVVGALGVALAAVALLRRR